MKIREDRQQDIQDQRALFQKVVALLDALRAADPTIIEVVRFPDARLWEQKGHLLFFQQGSGRTIGFGQIERRERVVFGRVHEISILRSQKSPSLFQLNRGPAGDLEAIATDIVESFLRRACIAPGPYRKLRSRCVL